MAFSNPYAPTITNVSLPFSNPIPGGLTSGKQIQIQGVVQNHPDADGFSINLCYGPKLAPNCALHFNPRFNQGCIVCNAMQGGSWGAEERGGGMPLIKGQLFEIIIMATPSSYQIAVNGVHFTEFSHRLPMENVKYLFIDGKYMKISFIKYEGGNMETTFPPEMFPGYGPAPGAAPPPYTPGGFKYPISGGQGSDALYNPSVPLTLLVAGGMHSNKIIYISGVPHPGAKRFSINLQEGPSGKDISFHFDVRLRCGNDCNVVVRNTLAGGAWGSEERAASYFPFMPGAAFDMIIMATPNSFKVAVNNSHFIEYAHRVPLHKASTLNISGDVKITSLRFQ